MTIDLTGLNDQQLAAIEATLTRTEAAAGQPIDLGRIVNEVRKLSRRALRTMTIAGGGGLAERSRRVSGDAFAALLLIPVPVPRDDASADPAEAYALALGPDALAETLRPSAARPSPRRAPPEPDDDGEPEPRLRSPRRAPPEPEDDGEPEDPPITRRGTAARPEPLALILNTRMGSDRRWIGGEVPQHVSRTAHAHGR